VSCGIPVEMSVAVTFPHKDGHSPGGTELSVEPRAEAYLQVILSLWVDDSLLLSKG
jgi:hypothetical protein